MGLAELQFSQARLLVWLSAVVLLCLVSSRAESSLSPTSDENQCRSLFIVLGLSLSLYPVARAVLDLCGLGERAANTGTRRSLSFCGPAFCVILETLLLFQIVFSPTSFHETLSSLVAACSLPLLAAAAAALFSEIVPPSTSPAAAASSSFSPSARFLTAVLGGLSFLFALWYEGHAKRARAAPTSDALPPHHHHHHLHDEQQLQQHSPIFSTAQLGLLLAMVVFVKHLALSRARASTPGVASASSTGAERSAVLLHVFVCASLLVVALLAFVYFLSSGMAQNEFSSRFLCSSLRVRAASESEATAHIHGADPSNADASSSTSAASPPLLHEPAALPLSTCGFAAAALVAYQVMSISTVLSLPSIASSVHLHTSVWAAAASVATLMHMVSFDGFVPLHGTWLAVLLGTTITLVNVALLAGRFSLSSLLQWCNSGDHSGTASTSAHNASGLGGGTVNTVSIRRRLSLLHLFPIALFLLCLLAAARPPPCTMLASRYPSISRLAEVARQEGRSEIPASDPPTTVQAELEGAVSDGLSPGERTFLDNDDDQTDSATKQARRQTLVSALPAYLQPMARRELVVRKLAALRQQIADIYADHIIPNAPVVLVGLPNHWNIGDSFIWQGQKMVLDALGYNVAYICVDIQCKKEQGNITAAVKNGTILIHGGGNYGDLYRFSMQLLHWFVTRFPNNRIIQLPNSIFYKETQFVLSDMRVHFGHPDFRLFVRDQPSYQHVVRVMETNLSHALVKAPYSTFRDRLVLCPDSALAIGTVIPNCKPTYDVVFLSRRDGEKIVNASLLGTLFKAAKITYTVVDWSSGWRYMYGRPLYQLYPRTFEEYPLFRLHAGNNILCRGRVVVSDRLHASIFSLLMGRPFVGMDNVYHKMHNVLNLAFHDDAFLPTLSEDEMNVFPMDTEHQVVQKVQELLAAMPRP